jgi:hypothetical protein
LKRNGDGIDSDKMDDVGIGNIHGLKKVLEKLQAKPSRNSSSDPPGSRSHFANISCFKGRDANVFMYVCMVNVCILVFK